MPWNSWCGTCSAHIGAGVRYNAEKKKQGMYLSTPIWGFRCKCHLCSGWFEIRTDPQVSRGYLHQGTVRLREEEAEQGWSFGRQEGRRVAAEADLSSFALSLYSSFLERSIRRPRRSQEEV